MLAIDDSRMIAHVLYRHEKHAKLIKKYYSTVCPSSEGLTEELRMPIVPNLPNTYLDDVE